MFEGLSLGRIVLCYLVKESYYSFISSLIVNGCSLHRERTFRIYLSK